MKSNDPLIAAIRCAKQRVDALHDARMFSASMENREITFQPITGLGAEIAIVEQLPAVQTGGWYPTSSHVYRRAYIEALEELIILLDSPDEELYLERHHSHGCRAALTFMLEQSGNSDVLLHAFEYHEGVQRLQSERMEDGAVPMRYTAGYLDGLQMVLQIIEAVEGGDNQMMAYPPDWFLSDALPQIQDHFSTRQRYSPAQTAYEIVLEGEGDLWRLQRAIERQQQHLAQYERSRDARMVSVTQDVIMWLEQGQEIIGGCLE